MLGQSEFIWKPLWVQSVRVPSTALTASNTFHESETNVGNYLLDLDAEHVAGVQYVTPWTFPVNSNF